MNKKKPYYTIKTPCITTACIGLEKMIDTAEQYVSDGIKENDTNLWDEGEHILDSLKKQYTVLSKIEEEEVKSNRETEEDE